MQSPASLLERADETARLLTHARLLRRLGGLFAAAVPSGLAAEARVANFRRGTVVLHATNGAVAAKLRQLMPRLAEMFAKSGLECSRIEVKVQPVRHAPLVRYGQKKPLTQHSVATLTARAASLPADSPLAAALKTLVARCTVHADDADADVA